MVTDAWAATNYGFSIGDVTVTSQNCNNITKEGIITINSGGHLYYTPSENTLYVKNVIISMNKGKNAFYNQKKTNLTIVFEGYNRFVSGDAETFFSQTGMITIKCINGGRIEMACSQSGNTIGMKNHARLVLDQANLIANSSNGAGVDGDSSGSMKIMDSEVTIQGKTGAITNLNSLSVSGSSSVTNTGNQTAVTINNVEILTLTDVAFNEPKRAYFDANMKAVCTPTEPSGTTKTVSFAVPVGIAINNTNFPDDNFREFLMTWYDKNGNNYLSDDEIAVVSGMRVDRLSIANLKGIEYFTNLKELDCDINQLSSLDLSKNTALTKLVCYRNQLSSLDLSQNTALKELDCFENQLTSLDLYKNTALTKLVCYRNQMSSLDLSQNIALEELDCSENQLTSLIVSNIPTIYWLSCDYNKLTSLDVSGCTELYHLCCRQNIIKGLAMDALIASLPSWETRTGHLLAINDTDEYREEHNVVTTTQVAAANEKGWKVYRCQSVEESGVIDQYIEYEGSAVPTDIPTLSPDTDSDSPFYSLDGQRIVGKPTKKGVYVRDGRKVVVK